MLSQQLARRPAVAARGGAPLAPARLVRARLFRRSPEAPVLDDGLNVEFNQPTKRQREALRRALQDLGFTEQAADILAYGKVTSSNADLLIGDIRASFGIYAPPPPQGPVESVQSGVQDLLGRLRLPFLGLLLAAGLAAAAANRESLASLFSGDAGLQVADSISLALDDVVDVLSRLPFADSSRLEDVQDAIDEFLFNLLQR